MSQVLTPEEMAALFEGLREAEDGPGSLYYHAPQEEPRQDAGFSLNPAELTVFKIYRPG